MEGRLVNTTLMRLAERDRLDSRAREGLQASIEFIERSFDGLGFCLSEDGDLLSQWRGYADDARGVSIGFKHSYLQALQATRDTDAAGFSIYKVEYEQEKHDEGVEPTYRELRRLIDDGAFKTRGTRSLLDVRTPEEVAADDKQIEQAHTSLLYKLLGLFPKLYELKAPAFREEREWRLVSIFSGADTDSCQFRASGGRIVPYRAFELKQLTASPVAEVVLGPRHETPPQVVQSLLKQGGFGEVSVRRSQASYR